MRLPRLSLSLVLVLALMGCATAPPQKATPQAPLFQWDPPERALPKSADVTFALVSPRYSQDEPWTKFWPFTDFSRNLGHDFEEMLTAKGYSFRGPFATYDEMTFPDKDGSDLVLQPSLDITLDVLNPTRRENVHILGPRTYSLQGDAAISGRITLAVMESLTNERMWSKSIELPRAVVSWKGQTQYEVPPNAVDPSDPGLYEPIGAVLEGFYAEIMKTAWQHLDPAEMRSVKDQAQPLKKRKVY